MHMASRPRTNCAMGSYDRLRHHSTAETATCKKVLIMESLHTHHQDRSSPVEAGAIGMLPDVLDLVRFPANEAFCEVLVRAFDGLGVALQRAFAPSDDTLFGFDADEDPSRRKAEYLCRT